MTGVASANTDVTSCTSIDSSGSYELSGDIDVTQSDYTTRKSCLEINASDVTLDGNGYTIDGYSDNTFDNNGFPDEIDGSTGVRVNGTGAKSLTNVTIENVELESGNRGINATHAPDIELTDITVTGADLQGIGVRQTDGKVSLQNVETKNSPSLPDGDFDMEPAVYLGSDMDSVLPDNITISNLLVNGTEYPNKTSFKTPAVETATEDGPISISDSKVTDTPRWAIKADTLGGFGAGDVAVENLSVSDFDRINVDGKGIYVKADAGVTINDTSVTGGGTSANRTEDAIYVENDNGGDISVTNSTVRHIYSDDGLELLADGSGTVHNVTVHNNTYRRGVSASAVDTLDVDDVVVTQTGDRYAAILDGETANIRNVTVNDTNEGGLKTIDLGASITLQDATISNVSGPSPIGLDVDTAEGTYENVSVTDVAGRGIRFWENDDPYPDGTLTLANATIENVSEYGIDLDGANLKIENTTVIDAGGDSIRKTTDSRDGTALDVVIRDVSVQNSGGKGIRLFEDSFDDLDTIDLTNVTVTNTTENDLQLDGIAATLDGFNVSSAILDGTARSVTVDNVTDTARPTPPSDKDDIGAYVEASNTTAAGYLNATIQYEDSDVPADLDESTLSLWRHDGSWSEVGGSVDTAANSVTANSTEFSVFAPLGTSTSATASFNVTINSTNAPVTEGEQLSVNATVNNTGTATGTQTVTLSTNGTQRDTTDLSLSPDVSQSLTLNWTTSQGDEGPYTATVATANDSNTTSIDVTAASDGDDDDDTTSGGGGGGSASAPDDEDEIDAAPAVEETSAIEESSVDFESTDTVGGVTFDEEATGSVEVEEYDEPPAAVDEAVSEVVTEELATEDSASDDDSTAEDGTDAGGGSDTDPDVVTVADVSPTDPDVEESSATVEFEVDREEFDDPDDAVVFHETDDGWTDVETTVEETDGETLTVAGQVESFSLFAVAEVESDESTQTDASTGEETTDDGGTSESADDTGDDDSGGVGAVVIGILVVAGGIGAVYVLRQ